MPLIAGIGFPLTVNYSIHRSAKALAAAAAPGLMGSFSVWSIVAAAVTPTDIASYGLAGEKIQKSLESCLPRRCRTEASYWARHCPPALMGARYAGSIAFMELLDHFTRSLLGYHYYPNWDI